MDWNSVSLVVGGLGLGGIIATALQTWMQRGTDARNKAFIEKRDCYLGLIESLKDANNRHDKSVVMQYAYWKARAALVGSPAVARLAQHLSETTIGSPERIKAYNDLQTEMRKDLGIDTRGLE